MLAPKKYTLLQTRMKKVQIWGTPAHKNISRFLWNLGIPAHNKSALDINKQYLVEDEMM